jgi:hypothetical protein
MEVLLKISGLLNFELGKQEAPMAAPLLTFAGAKSGDLLKVLAIQGEIQHEEM